MFIIMFIMFVIMFIIMFIMFIIMFIHNDFSSSGEQPEQRKLAQTW